VCWFFPICLFFVIGMGFAHFRPKVRIHPVLEAVAIPLCLGTYYYLGQYVSTYYAALPGAIFFLAVLQERSLTARVLCARPLQFLGMISYSLYLVHPFAVFPFQMIGHLLLARGFAPAQIFLPYVACAAVATFALSIPSYYLIEVRLRSAIVGWMKGRRIRAQERLA
jgi:peptidoglycan/LPS O-acetylase OafA/YrhL